MVWDNQEVAPVIADQALSFEDVLTLHHSFFFGFLRFFGFLPSMGKS